MELKNITGQFAVSPQITADDLTAIKDAGFRAIICNRPDGEEADQPRFAEIAAAARALGIKARHVPVQSGRVAEADIEAFAAALRVLPGPILAYCRSGTRSATLWSFHETRQR